MLESNYKQETRTATLKCQAIYVSVIQEHSFSDRVGVPAFHIYIDTALVDGQNLEGRKCFYLTTQLIHVPIYIFLKLYSLICQMDWHDDFRDA